MENSNPDPRFLRYAATTDGATVKLIVEDVDEPPVFDRVGYVMEVKEDVAVGTIIGSVSATDPDSSRSPVRYYAHTQTHTLGRGEERTDTCTHTYTLICCY